MTLDPTEATSQAETREAFARALPLEALVSCPLNPRTTFARPLLDELATSIREVGIIEPIVVRPDGDGKYQVVAGERRFRAAKLCGILTVPAIIRDLSDAQVLEIQVIENTHRADLNPIEEAEGYAALLKTGYALDRLAGRIARSVKYVYDRLKLLDLIPGARKLAVDGTITAGHAILLARLKPGQQKRVIDTSTAALFVPENTLWNPDVDEPDRYKTRSVREFQTWIDEHDRFDPTSPTVPHLFPETAEAISFAAAAAEDAGQPAEQPIPITHDHYVQPDARDAKTRIYGPRSWKRADGTGKGKTAAKACPQSVLGVVVIGPERGAAFRVCVDKACGVHWSEERRIAKVRQQGKESVAANREARQAERQEATYRREQVAREQWKRVTPDVLKACAASLRKPAGIGLMLETAARAFDNRDLKAGTDLVGRGSGAEGALRLLAAASLCSDVDGYDAHKAFPPYARRLGVDVRSILAADAKAHPPAKKGKG